MTNYLFYLLQVSVVFACLVAFYYFFLRQLTFHGFNRGVLLMLMPLALIIPLLDLPSNSSLLINYPLEVWQFEASITQSDDNQIYTNFYEQNNSILFYIAVIYWIGVSIGLSFFVLSILRMGHIKRLAKPLATYQNVYLSGNVTTAFSFFKWVFLPKGLKPMHQSIIIKHELAHVNYLHTFDLFVLELFSVFLWFNPMVILFKKLLKSVHEYQVDTQITQNHTTTSDYLQLLLENLSSTNATFLSSYFNHFSIKNRIVMMTKNKSKQIHSAKYLLLLPLITIILVAFTLTVGTEPSIFPIKEGLYEKISSPYGVHRKNPITKKVQHHNGIDIIAKKGTPVLATGSGKVIKAELYKAYGNMIVIDHGGNIQTIYAHLHKITVKVGKQVTVGDEIGEVGSTGVSTGPHLHYEVRKNGKHIDPTGYFGK